MSLKDPTTLGARLDALAREDDDIPDRLRTLAAEREDDTSDLAEWRRWFRESGNADAWAKVKCIECELERNCLMVPPCPDAVQRIELREWLDRKPPSRSVVTYVNGMRTVERVASSWRDFERDCTCNPGPVPVEGGFVWRRCSCDNLGQP